MAILGEDGTGVAGAEAYGADPVALITAYWAARPNDSLSATWAAPETTNAIKEGAARTAAAYIDATWGAYFIGHRASQAQGLAWPRVAGLGNDGAPKPLVDALGAPLPALPPQILAAQAELAGRAVSGPLAKDAGRGGRIKAVGAGSARVEFADGAPAETSFGIVLGILAPILDGAQPGASSATWFWR